MQHQPHDPIIPNVTQFDLSSPYNTDERAAATFKMYQQVKNQEQTADDHERQSSKTANFALLQMEQYLCKEDEKKDDINRSYLAWSLSAYLL